MGKPLAVSLCRSRRPAREGTMALQLGLPGAPAADEAAALAALIEQLEAIPAPIHILHLSTARGVALVAEAKSRGLPVSASTTWLHLLRDTSHLQSYDPNLRVHPPLGAPADRAALVRGVAAGILEAIAVEHCPYTYEEKTLPFAEAPPGAIGFETALPLLWHHLVGPELSALELWQALSTGAARCLGQPPASIKVGEPAELTLFDPAATWQVSARTLASMARNTPWLDQTIAGRIVQVWAAPQG